jgi:quercetin dioxygenase-like cupin family protein
MYTDLTRALTAERDADVRRRAAPARLGHPPASSYAPEEVAPEIESDTRLTTLDNVLRPHLPDGAGMMTVLVEIPPGSQGTAPHRHSGPVFGYLSEGSMIFELEGEAPRLINPGEAFSEPGGEVVHWQAANALDDRWTRFIAVMVCVPGVPMLTYLDDEEIARRQPLRHPSACETEV